MRWLILDTYYEEFLRHVYKIHHALDKLTYDEQHRILMDQYFGTGDFYSSNLKRQGHEAEEIVANCEPLQRRWAGENGMGWVGLISAFGGLPGRWGKGWLFRVLAEQVRKLSPDILYIQDMNWTDRVFLDIVRPMVRLIVGQTASALSHYIDYRYYDLVVTSFPHYVEMFKEKGIPSAYLRLAFEPEVLKELGRLEPAYGAVFIGAFAEDHVAGTSLLERVAQDVRVDFWGRGAESLAPESPIRWHFHGEAWGLDMYRILAQSRIALNRHSTTARQYANNMRLYEATGVGALLITDHKDNLHELFEPGKEVVAYRNVQECAELVGYYLEHEEERAAIARAGQERTLREHTYYHCMEELVAIVEQHLRHPGRARGGVS